MNLSILSLMFAHKRVSKRSIVTLQELGEYLSVSKQRAYQICRMYKVDRKDPYSLFNFILTLSRKPHYKNYCLTL